MVSRLFMRQSRFLDQPAVYELLVHDITRKLYRCDGMHPYCTDRYAWEGYAEDEESDAVDAEIVQTSLRENADSTEWWRQQACPVGLLPSAQDAVQAPCICAAGAELLPDCLCTAQMPRRPCNQRGLVKVARWLNSEEAALWRIDRKNLFPGSTCCVACLVAFSDSGIFGAHIAMTVCMLLILLAAFFLVQFPAAIKST